jgi:uncharacterized protein with NAD-binding domain and iron-sulfur cluster
MKWTGHADKPLPAIIAHKGIKEKLKRELHMSWPKKGVQPRHRYWNITLSLEMLRHIPFLALVFWLHKSVWAADSHSSECFWTWQDKRNWSTRNNALPVASREPTSEDQRPGWGAKKRAFTGVNNRFGYTPIDEFRFVSSVFRGQSFRQVCGR